MLPSHHLGFLNVPTDGKRKNRHNQEILFLSRLLKKAGIKYLNLHHINDVDLDKFLPVKIGNKIYDITYIAPDGELFMVEIMRIKYAKGQIKMEDDTLWQKDAQVK